MDSATNISGSFKIVGATIYTMNDDAKVWYGAHNHKLERIAEFRDSKKQLSNIKGQLSQLKGELSLLSEKKELLFQEYQKLSDGRKNKMRSIYDTCVVCGSKNDLQVHHLIPTRISFIYDLKQFEDLQYLRMLCGKCHRELHKRLKTRLEQINTMIIEKVIEASQNILDELNQEKHVN